MSNSPQMPSLKEMVYSLNDTAREILSNAIKNKVILATEEQAKERLDICLTCEFFVIQPEGSIMPARCSKCGCGMKVKSRFAAASCPIGKWKAVIPQSK